MADRAMQRVIADVCLSLDGDDALAADPQAFFDARGVSPVDRDALLERSGRLQLYRRLVRGNLEGVVHQILGATRARMNASVDGLFDATLAQMLDQAPPRTHHLRDVPGELVRWALPRWEADARVERWLLDLARYELAYFEVASLPRLEVPQSLGELALEARVALCPVMRLVCLSAGVDALEAEGHDAPDPAPKRLLLYRDDQHEVRSLELGAVAFELIAALERGSTLREALTLSSERSGHALDDQLLGDLSALLADLAERGVVLGSERANDD